MAQDFGVRRLDAAFLFFVQLDSTFAFQRRRLTKRRQAAALQSLDSYVSYAFITGQLDY